MSEISRSGEGFIVEHGHVQGKTQYVCAGVNSSAVGELVPSPVMYMYVCIHVCMYGVNSSAVGELVPSPVMCVYVYMYVCMV